MDSPLNIDPKTTKNNFSVSHQLPTNGETLTIDADPSGSIQNVFQITPSLIPLTINSNINPLQQQHDQFCLYQGAPGPYSYQPNPNLIPVIMNSNNYQNSNTYGSACPPDGFSPYTIPVGLHNGGDSTTSLAGSTTTVRLPRATLEQKLEVLNWFHASDERTQQDTVDYFQNKELFSITKSTLNRWILSERQLRDDYKTFSLNFTKTYKTRPKFKDPEVTRCLEFLYEQSCNENLPLSEKSLTQKWTQLSRKYHNIPLSTKLQEQNKSNGWLHHFKKRHAIQKSLSQKLYNDNYINEPRTVAREILRLKNIIKDYSPSNVFQLDEISFSSRPTFLKGNDNLQKIKNGMSITDSANLVIVSLLANGDGSRLIDPLIITNDSMVRDLESQSSNIYYNKNALLTSDIFFRYLKYIDGELLNQPTILILDDLHAHIVPLNDFQFLKIVYFSPKITDISQNILQPLDFGLKRIFKCMVKLAYIQTIRKGLNEKEYNPDSNIELPKSGLVDFVMEATRSLQTSNCQPYISFGFHKSGLIELGFNNNEDPFYSKDLVKEQQLELLLQDFKERRTLSASFLIKLNQNGWESAIDELIFPEDENIKNEHLTDDDVIILVRREMELLEEPRSSVSITVSPPAVPTIATPTIERVNKTGSSVSSITPITPTTKINSINEPYPDLPLRVQTVNFDNPQNIANLKMGFSGSDNIDSHSEPYYKVHKHLTTTNIETINTATNNNTNANTTNTNTNTNGETSPTSEQNNNYNTQTKNNTNVGVIQQYVDLPHNPSSLTTSQFNDRNPFPQDLIYDYSVKIKQENFDNVLQQNFAAYVENSMAAAPANSDNTINHPVLYSTDLGFNDYSKTSEFSHQQQQQQQHITNDNSNKSYQVEGYKNRKRRRYEYEEIIDE